VSKGISRLEFEDLKKWVTGLSIQLGEIRADLNRSPPLYPGQPGQLKDLRNDIGRLSKAISRIDVDVWRLKEGEKEGDTFPEPTRCSVRFELRTLIYRCCKVVGHSGAHMGQ